MDADTKALAIKHKIFFKKQNPKIIKDLIDYTHEDYRKINTLLRTTKGNLSEISDDNVEKKKIQNIDLLFSLVDPITKPITLFRGVRKEQYTKEDFGYVSTSFDMEIPMEYVNAREQCCLIEITLPVGTKCLCIESISRYEGEKEVLLPRNGTFVLTSVAKSRTVKGIDRYFVTFFQDSVISGKSIKEVVQKL